MKIKLTQTYLDQKTCLADIDRQIAELDKRLKTPERTVDDIIRHIELLKERALYL